MKLQLRRDCCTVIQQPVANGLEGSGCHFEDILDFGVRNLQAAHRDISDSVASILVEIGMSETRLWLTDYAPIGLCCCLSPKDGVKAGGNIQIEQPFKNTSDVYTALNVTSWKVGENLKRKSNLECVCRREKRFIKHTVK